jgi:hypothetical protein
LIVIVLCCLGVAPQAQSEEVRVTSDAELARALTDAAAGDAILLAPGEYRGGIATSTLHGERELPIVVRGEDPEHPPVITGGNVGIHLSSPQFVELRHLVVDGLRDNGLNIDDSGKVDTPAVGIVLHDVVVRNIGPEGNRDGIKCSGVDEFRIEQCTVESWGASGSAIDFVGCHDGVVDGCKFLGAGSSNANAVQVKGGSRGIVVRSSRFENIGGRSVNLGGSTGLPYFRPADAEYEAKDITVEDCEFLGGDAAVAFVGVDGAIVRHNTIYRPRRWVLRILQENTDPRFVACRNGQFVKNAVIFRSDELRQAANVGGSTSPESFTFAENVWHCLDRDVARRLIQLPVEEKDGVYDQAIVLADPEAGDLRIQQREASDAGVRSEGRDQ